jgi:hypothetical protein
LFEKGFQVGYIDGDFASLGSLQWNLYRVFVEGLKEAHLGYGVLFTAGEGTAV